eukprot:5445948-Ditylum_brightwellii.AAC.1
MMMNNLTGQDQVWARTMVTVITKQNKRNRDSRNSANSEEKINNLQSKKMIFLCKHHQKLSSNMRGSFQLKVRDPIQQEVKNSWKNIKKIQLPKKS